MYGFRAIGFRVYRVYRVSGFRVGFVVQAPRVVNRLRTQTASIIKPKPIPLTLRLTLNPKLQTLNPKP